jgi:5-methylcytosine-specific restriction endonuclease McrA
MPEFTPKLTSEQIEEARKKILKIRFEQYHVKIDGVWRESKRVRNADDGEPCVVCGWYNSQSRICCIDDKRCKTLGRKMNLCLGEDPFTNSRQHRIGIHEVEKNDWRYDRHYSYECTFCKKLIRKEKMSESVIDERFYSDEPPKAKARRKITGALRHEVFTRDEYRCLECGRTNKNGVLHVDHIIPVASGGLTILSNLQTLCSICNHAKWKREWKSGLRTKNEEPELLMD